MKKSTPAEKEGGETAGVPGGPFRGANIYIIPASPMFRVVLLLREA